MESHSSAATELDIFHADALSGGTELGAYAASVAIELQIVVLSCCPRARSTSSLREGALRGYCEELRDDRWYRCPACRPDLSRFQANKRLAVVNLLLATAQRSQESLGRTHRSNQAFEPQNIYWTKATSARQRKH